ncbi:hypothetical protein WJX74_007910 [Apatococcus lobatus]|uniref:Uncharacterized protein n=1 Tax=Apatococcus lobatus TaxID=904363 RepID=A0AAW1QK99_9CHLO
MLQTITSQEASELHRLRQEVTSLQSQLVEVKRVDDQELDKLWQLAESQSNQLTQDRAKLAELESTCADQKITLAKAQSQEARVQADFSCLNQAYASAQSQLQHATSLAAAQPSSDSSKAAGHHDKACQTTIQDAIRDALQEQLPEQLGPMLQELISQQMAKVPAPPSGSDLPFMQQILPRLQDLLLTLTRQVKGCQTQLTFDRWQQEEQQRLEQRQIPHVTQVVTGIAEQMTLKVATDRGASSKDRANSSTAIHEGLTAIIEQFTKEAASQQTGLDIVRSLSHSLHALSEEVTRVIKQRLGDTAEDIRTISPLMKQLSACLLKLESSHTAELASLQKSCTNQEGKLRAMKQAQESQGTSLKLLSEQLDGIQGSLKPFGFQFKDIVSRLEALGQMHQALPGQPGQPSDEILQAVNQRFTVVDRSLDALMKGAARQITIAQGTHAPAELIKSVNDRLSAMSDGMKELLVTANFLKQLPDGSERAPPGTGPGSTQPGSATGIHQLQRLIYVTPGSGCLSAVGSDSTPRQPVSSNQVEGIKCALGELISSGFQQLESSIAEVQQSQKSDRVRTKLALQGLGRLEHMLQQLPSATQHGHPAEAARVTPGSPGVSELLMSSDQREGSNALQHISTQLQSIQVHLGIDQDRDGETLIGWLSKLRDLPRAALLTVLGLDNILERLDDLQVQLARKDGSQCLEGLMAAGPGKSSVPMLQADSDVIMEDDPAAPPAATVSPRPGHLPQALPFSQSCQAPTLLCEEGNATCSPAPSGAAPSTSQRPLDATKLAAATTAAAGSTSQAEQDESVGQLPRPAEPGPTAENTTNTPPTMSDHVALAAVKVSARGQEEVGPAQPPLPAEPAPTGRHCNVSPLDLAVAAAAALPPLPSNPPPQEPSAPHHSSLPPGFGPIASKPALAPTLPAPSQLPSGPQHQQLQLMQVQPVGSCTPPSKAANLSGSPWPAIEDCGKRYHGWPTPPPFLQSHADTRLARQLHAPDWHAQHPEHAPSSLAEAPFPDPHQRQVITGSSNCAEPYRAAPSQPGRVLTPEAGWNQETLPLTMTLLSHQHDRPRYASGWDVQGPPTAQGCVVRPAAAASRPVASQPWDPRRKSMHPRGHASPDGLPALGPQTGRHAAPGQAQGPGCNQHLVQSDVDAGQKALTTGALGSGINQKKGQLQFSTASDPAAQPYASHRGLVLEAAHDKDGAGTAANLDPASALAEGAPIGVDPKPRRRKRRDYAHDSSAHEQRPVRRQKAAFECTCCSNKKGRFWRFPCQASLDEHQLQPKHLWNVKQRVKALYGVIVDHHARVTGGDRRKPQRLEVPYGDFSKYSCVPCGIHEKFGYYDYMLHLLRRSHLDTLRARCQPLEAEPQPASADDEEAAGAAASVAASDGPPGEWRAVELRAVSFYIHSKAVDSSFL